MVTPSTSIDLGCMYRGPLQGTGRLAVALAVWNQRCLKFDQIEEEVHDPLSCGNSTGFLEFAPKSILLKHFQQIHVYLHCVRACVGRCMCTYANIIHILTICRYKDTHLNVCHSFHQFTGKSSLTCSRGNKNRSFFYV